MEWLSDIFSKVMEGFQLSMQALNDFVVNLNDASNMLLSYESNSVGRYVGAFRFVVGDFIYSCFFLLIMLGLGYTIFHILVLIKNMSFLGGSGIIGTIKNLFLR